MGIVFIYFFVFLDMVINRYYNIKLEIIDIKVNIVGGFYKIKYLC